MKDWQGKVVLVTGASSGIGAAVARKLAGAGLRVALVARREDCLEEQARQIELAGGQARVLAADLTMEVQRERVLDDVSVRWGCPDVLVNSAGFGWYGYGVRMPWALAQRMIEVNVSATIHLTLLCLPEMIARGSGHVINIGSIAGDLPGQGTALYAGTKALVGAFTSSLYRELCHTGVFVSVVKPGPVATGFFDVTASQPGGHRMPAQRFAVSPERVACAVWSLIRHPRRIVYVPPVMRFAAWAEHYLGWLLDAMGPVLLRRQGATSYKSGSAWMIN